MGMITNVTILNDVIGDFEDDKEGFFDLISNQMCSSQARAKAKHSGVVVNSVEHSSTTSIIAVGGNYSTVLCHTGSVSHHKEEGQVELLKELAEKLGYTIQKA